MKTIQHAAALAVLAAAALTACGGGGGGTDGDGSVPVPAGAPVALSTANYEAVAQKTLTANAYLSESAGFVVGAQLAPGGQAVLAWARAQLARLPGALARAPRVAIGAVTTDVVNCSGGGSISIQINDANGNDQTDAGDSASFTASNCVEDGATTNGGLSVAITAASGDLDGTVYSATVNITLNALRLTTAAGSASGSGGMQLVISSTDADTNVADITVANLTMSSQFAGVSDSISLQNWRSTSSTARSNGVLRTSTTTSGVYTSSALASGSVTVATLQPMVQADSDAYPSSGQITTTGANGSKMRITAQNNSTVLLELDADGNGSYETSTVKAWGDLT